MIDNDLVTEVIILIASFYYGTVSCGVNWSPCWRSKIGTFVELSTAVNWISSLTIFTCNRILWIKRASHGVKCRINTLRLLHRMSNLWKDGQEAKQDEGQDPCHVSLYQM